MTATPTTTATAPVCGACNRTMGDGPECCQSVEECDAYRQGLPGPALLELLRLSVERLQRGETLPSRRTLELPRERVAWPERKPDTGPAVMGRGRLRTRWATTKCGRCGDLYDPAQGSGAVCPKCFAETGRRHA